MGMIKLQDQVTDLNKRQGVANDNIAKLEENTKASIERLETANNEINGTVSEVMKESKADHTKLQSVFESGLKDQLTIIGQIKDTTLLHGENFKNIEPRVKNNEDHNKQIDDAIDAINSSVTGLGGQQTDLAENLNQVNILVNKTQVLMKEQEENLQKQSLTDLNEVKKNITALGERSDVSERKISELDTGTQGLLEKLLGLEDENRNNKQGIVTIKESLVLQSENIKKVENERQNSEAKAKEDLETTVNTNARAISDLKIEVERALDGSSLFMKESIEKMERKQDEKMLETNKNVVDKVKDFEDILTVTKHELNNTCTKNMHKLEILDDKMNNIDDDQHKFKNQIEEVSNSLRNHSLSVEKASSEMKLELKNSIVETNKKLNLFIEDMQNIQNTNKDFLDEHEQKLIKVLQSTDEQSGVSSALTTRIESVETKISSYDEKNKTLTENILVTNETQLKDFRNTFDSRIAELCKRSDQHSDQFDQAELKMVDLVKKMNENQHHITRDFEEIRKNISDDKSLLIIQLKEQSEKFESVYNSIDDKVELMETKFVTKVC